MARITKTFVRETMKNNPALFYEPMPDAWKELFPVLTVAELEEMGLHFTVNHTGKMAGMVSLSTTCKCNADCQDKIRRAYESLGIDMENIKDARKAIKKYIEKNPLATNVSICGLCFSDKQQDFQETMRQPLEKNYDILNNGIIHDDWIPVINALFSRGESFGDFASPFAAVNHFKLAYKNNHVNFTSWSKNLRYFHAAVLMGYEKPANFKLVYSSQLINVIAKIPEKYTYLVDAVFTVCTKAFAETNNITINCGARACLSCLRCYTGYTDGKVKYIFELLK